MHNVNLAAALSPTVVNLSNDAGHNYTFSGTGDVAGQGSPPQARHQHADRHDAGERLHRGTYIQNGTLAVGIANALPVAGTVTIGDTATSGTLDLDGFGQTLPAWPPPAPPPARPSPTTAALAATLAYAGGSSSFGSTIRDRSRQTLLAVTSGVLSLTGRVIHRAPPPSAPAHSPWARRHHHRQPGRHKRPGVLAGSVTNGLSGTRFADRRRRDRDDLPAQQLQRWHATSRTAPSSWRRLCPADHRGHRHHRQRRHRRRPRSQRATPRRSSAWLPPAPPPTRPSPTTAPSPRTLHAHLRRWQLHLRRHHQQRPHQHRRPQCCSGTLTLAGANNYSGGTTLSGRHAEYPVGRPRQPRRPNHLRRRHTPNRRRIRRPRRHPRRLHRHRGPTTIDTNGNALSISSITAAARQWPRQDRPAR